MRNIFLSFGFALFLPFLFSSCIFVEDIADITLENASEYEVKNITLIYYHGTKGKQTKRIDALQPGKATIISAILQETAVQTFTSDVEIEYYINGTKFDVRNEENVNVDDTGYAYTNARIGAGNNIKFTIRNNGYSVQK